MLPVRTAIGGETQSAGSKPMSCACRGLVLRVDPAQTDSLITDPRASRFVMRGREMDGWHARLDVLATDDQLNGWVRHGVAWSMPAR